MTAEEALDLTARLVGISLVVQTLELLAVRRALSDEGIFRFRDLAAELERAAFPVRALGRALLPYRRFCWLLWAQLLAAGALVVGGHSPVVALAACTAAIVCLRFRGTYNGGSDSMTVLSLLALSLAALSDHAILRSGCLLWIAVQCALSYFVAGIAKLKEPAWRDGRALAHFAALARYTGPASVRTLLARPCLAVAGSWAVLLFECSFPLAFTGPLACAVYLALALAFHAANALAFGLNRFLFAWPASYPAIVYATQELAR